MRVVVIGARGQLGSDLVPALLAGGHECVPLAHADIEICSPASLRENLARHQPQAVINCAVYHPVDECELHPDLSLQVNALAVRELALGVRSAGAVLVHISSDYVFDGETTRPYTEQDCPQPRTTFGVCKLAGEHFVRALLQEHFIVRTSGLYGIAGSPAKKGNFVETMLRLGRERGQVNVVDDLRMAQTSTRDLARQLVTLLETDCFGTYHAANHGDYSWYEFACKIFECAGMDVRVTPVSHQEMPALAPRPHYSVLDNAQLKQRGLDRMLSIDQALQEYLQARQAAAPSQAGTGAA